MKWHNRFLDMAKLVAGWSKDPSTKCGAVIADYRNRVVSVGYNGFARKVNDDADKYADREGKYRKVIHAETNAILFAQRDLRNTILYCTFCPCATCAAKIIQVGIDTVIIPELDWDSALLSRWKPDILDALSQFTDAGVNLYTLTGADLCPVSLKIT
jgi:dCMP deaminase